MPANKNAMTRYKILDELLSNWYHNYTIDDLTEEVNTRLSDLDKDSNGVVRRTIEKDLRYLEYEGPFMVDIERYSVQYYDSQKQRSYTKQCLRYAHQSFSIFKKEMSDDEKYLLKSALSLLGQFDGLPNLEALEGLRKELGMKENDRQIISFTKNILEKSSLIGELFTAISQKQVIELHYRKFTTPDKETVINLHPYLLKEYNQRWFLIATAEKDNKLLNFALDRIVSLKPLASHKYVEYEGNIAEIFEDIIGVTLYDNSPLCKIYFWASDEAKNYIITKPLHGSQVNNIAAAKNDELRKHYPALENGQIFMIECKFNYELIRELSSYGKDLMVLEPSDIQDMLFERCKSMYDNYSKLRTKNS